MPKERWSRLEEEFTRAKKELRLGFRVEKGRREDGEALTRITKYF